MGSTETLKVQVMMVGGRRCGKTSVLAAMKDNFETQFADTNLTIAIDDLDTLEILTAKINEINDYFLGDKSRNIIPDSNPTEDMMKYSYSIKIAGKKGKINVDFIDYPGEWLTDKVHLEELRNLITETQVIVVVIDTPHLMEEDGQYNEHRNFCYKTTEILKTALEDGEDGEKLILFVPLKCERYYIDGKMEQVRKRTEEVYANLINYFNRNKKKYEVAVTPIFTLGSVIFSHFGRDKQTREIKTNNYKTPEEAIYIFSDINVKKPSPKYCEQPVVYLLAYLFKMAEQKKNKDLEKGTLFDKALIFITEKFFNFVSASDYDEQKKCVLKRLKKEGDGYRIIQNTLNF
jgi:hypothetical protein